jgi:hypothetical protein
VSLAAPIYLFKHHQLKPTNIVIAAISTIALLGALAGSIYPAPAAPYNMLPYIFLTYLIAGITWYFFLKIYASETILVMENDLIAIRNRFEQETKQPKASDSDCSNALASTNSGRY